MHVSYIAVVDNKRDRKKRTLGVTRDQCAVNTHDMSTLTKRLPEPGGLVTGQQKGKTFLEGVKISKVHLMLSDKKLQEFTR